MWTPLVTARTESAVSPRIGANMRLVTSRCTSAHRVHCSGSTKSEHRHVEERSFAVVVHGEPEQHVAPAAICSPKISQVAFHQLQ